MVTCLSHMIKDHSLDIICLQETHKKKYTYSFMRRLDSYKNFVWEFIPSIGKSGGIMCGVRQSKFDITSWVRRKYILQVNTFDANKKIPSTLGVVYGATHDDYKQEFLMELVAATSATLLFLLCFI